MKIAPVYLVAPEPEPPRVTRRTAILGGLSFGLVAFTGGAAVGAYFSSSDGPETGNLTSDVDERLAWALELQAGPENELLKQHQFFLWVLGAYTEDRELLWPGVERLCELALSRTDIPLDVRQPIAELLVQTASSYGAPLSIRRRIPELRSLAR